jgi:LmbE family N-acetylglucosaminyl deacetylase
VTIRASLVTFHSAQEETLSKFNGSYIPKSAMTIFAHPDDSEFTIGGTIAKWAAAGCEITMVLCTSGNVGTHDPKYTLKTLAKTRETEQKAVADFFGVKHVVFLRFDDCALQPSLELSRKVVRTIRKYKPEVVLCGDPEGWFYGTDYINHPDHRAASIVALESVFPRCEMELFWPEEGPVHKVHAVYIHGAKKSETAIDIAATLDKKVGALKIHQSQLGEWDPTEMIAQWAQEEAKAARKRAKKKGQKAKADGGGKLQYAETFRVMTLVDQPQES